MENHNLDDLRAEFDKFVKDKCSLDPEEQANIHQDPDAGDKTDEEPVTWEAVLETFNKNVHNVLNLLLKTLEKF